MAPKGTTGKEYIRDLEAVVLAQKCLISSQEKQLSNQEKQLCNQEKLISTLEQKLERMNAQQPGSGSPVRNSAM